MARMRAKKHIPERMNAASERWFQVPMLNKGNWRETCGFSNDAKMFIEIGCGKGKFACEMASRNPEALYVAIEKDPSVTLAAIEKAHELNVPNLYFINMDAQLLSNYFEIGEVDRIFINFCDPWTKKNKPKRRLTYRDFLKQYEQILSPDGKIMFKTVDTDLFEFSVLEFEATGYALSEVTRDLHASEYDKDNVRTEFEQKFSDQGIAIKRLVAHRPKA